MASSGTELPQSVPGPAERTWSGHGTVNAVQNRALGDFAVAPLDPSREACTNLAERLGADPTIDKATAVPPNVYIRPSLAALHEAVTSGVIAQGHAYGTSTVGAGRVVQVQFSCPNMNKALHLGHLRTNVIGMSLAHAFAALGFRVIRTDQPSNWGRHIDKAVVAASRRPWPEGRADRAVGELYAWASRALADPETAPDFERELDDVMARLEAGDPDTLARNSHLTESVYAAIRQTYDRIGTRFDAVLREGDTLRISKAIIARHLGGHCMQREDGSVFIDLTDAGLREVNLLRREGGPLLHAYFLGASTRRHSLWPGSPFLFLMGREYAETVPELKEVVRRLSSPEMADNIEAVYHGMVGHGTKKMSSRTDAVDVDDLLDRVAADLLAGWEAASQEPLDPFHADVAERSAVALVKYHFLRTPRMKDVAWTEDDLWRSGLPRLAKVVRVLRHRPAAADCLPQGGRAEDEVRALLLAVNRLPDAVRETAVRRDPSHLVRFVDEVCERAEAAGRRGHVDQGLHEAVAIAVNRALDLLGVALPPFLAALPPALVTGALDDVRPSATRAC
jgi:arginyl-tRNA synthetase